MIDTTGECGGDEHITLVLGVTNFLGAFAGSSQLGV